MQIYIYIKEGFYKSLVFGKQSRKTVTIIAIIWQKKENHVLILLFICLSSIVYVKFVTRLRNKSKEIVKKSQRKVYCPLF